MSKLGILDFYESSKQLGFARDYLFRISDISFFGDDIQKYSIYVKSSYIPSREVGSLKVSHRGFNFNVPGQVSYADNTAWKMTIYCDELYLIRDMFEFWSTQVFDEHTMKSSERGSTISLKLLRDDLSPVREYMMRGVYPAIVGQVDYDSGGTGAPLMFTTTFAYSFVTSRSTLDELEEPPTTLLDRIRGISGTIGSVGRGVRSVRNVGSFL